MSFVCDVVIGYFDPKIACIECVALPRKSVESEEIQQLQTVFLELFGGKIELIDLLTDNGLLWSRAGGISHDIFRVACLAHELFGMSAVDVAHGCLVYPLEECPPPDLKDFVKDWRHYHNNWTDE